MELSLLEAARGGDDRAFAELIAPHTVELRVYCYRMLGSSSDAEDLLQETLTAAWKGLDGFAGRSSLRTWLYRIATNRCLNAIRTTKRQAPPEPVPPFSPPPPSRRDEITWLQPYPDTALEAVADPAAGPLARYEAREAIELAFVVALQRLPARQTAAVVLCDVLGFTAAEAVVALGTGATAVKGVLQRARATLDSDVSLAPDRAADVGSVEVQELAGRFADAFAADDVAGIVELLTDDAWLAMPPASHCYDGPAAMAAFLRASASGRQGRQHLLVPTRANAAPAFGVYLTGAGDAGAQPTGILVLTIRRDRISGITRFLDPRLPDLFGLTGPREP